MGAFSCVDEMVSRGVTNVRLVHVSEEPRVELRAALLMEELADSDKKRLEGFRERLLSRGAREVTAELLSGSPGREIVARAARGDSDLIVMGSQGRGLLEEVFLGSVSHYVARHASLPVLLVPFKGPK
jgi:nucleotide-binding universal stress UspA family protein